MFKSLDIHERMEVVGSDDKHVGTVDHKDHKEGVDRIILTKDDPSGTPPTCLGVASFGNRVSLTCGK